MSGPKVRDRDPALTCRRILLVVNAVGDSVPAKVNQWIMLSIEGEDGDVAKVRAFATAAMEGRILHNEAIATIRDVCARRIGDRVETWRGRA